MLTVLVGRGSSVTPVKFVGGIIGASGPVRDFTSDLFGSRVNLDTFGPLLRSGKGTQLILGIGEESAPDEGNPWTECERDVLHIAKETQTRVWIVVNSLKKIKKALCFRDSDARAAVSGCIVTGNRESGVGISVQRFPNLEEGKICFLPNFLPSCQEIRSSLSIG